MKYHLVYRKNGRYDPVLSDIESNTESIDQGVSHHTSQPVEVFLEVPHLIETTNLAERESVNKSLTSLTHTAKKYRPFSTELYNEFLQKNVPTTHGLQDNSSELYDTNTFSRFKLPISDQYDPEGKKIDGRYVEQRINQRLRQNRSITEIQDNETIITKSHNKGYPESVSFRADKDGYESFEKKLSNVREDLKITARKVVKESLEKAASVAEEIVKEIDVELNDVENAIPKIKGNNFSLSSSKTTELQQENLSREKVLLQEPNDIPKSVRETVQLYQSINTKPETTKEGKPEDERKMYLLQEIEESIEQGSVKRKSTIFENEATKLKQYNILNDRLIKKSTEMKAHILGSETITNVKKAAESSLSNSLLKVFFLYLTKVMVALTRYIPKRTFQLYDRSRNVENQGFTNLLTDDHQETIRKRKLSGADIAQQVSGKPKDLTERMDTVISEFHSKLHINNSHINVNDRRAKSCSRVEEGSKSNNTFEWLAGMDSEERELMKKEIKLATLAAARRVLGRRRSYHSLSDFENEPIDGLTYIAIVESHVYTNKNAIFDNYISNLKSQVNNTLESTDINKMEISAECLASQSNTFSNNQRDFRGVSTINTQEAFSSKGLFIGEVTGQKVHYVATVTVEHKQIPTMISYQKDEKSLEFNELALSDDNLTTITKITTVDNENKQLAAEFINKLHINRTENFMMEKPTQPTPIIVEREYIDKRISDATASQISEIFKEVQNESVEITEVKEEIPIVNLEPKELIEAQAVAVQTIKDIRTAQDETIVNENEDHDMISNAYALVEEENKFIALELKPSNVEDVSKEILKEQITYNTSVPVINEAVVKDTIRISDEIDGLHTITEVKKEIPITTTEEKKLDKVQVLNIESIRQATEVFTEVDIIEDTSYNLLEDKGVLITEAGKIIASKVTNEPYIDELPTELPPVQIDSEVSAESTTEVCLLEKAVATSCGISNQVTTECDTAVITENIKLETQIANPLIETKELLNVQVFNVATTRQDIEMYHEVQDDFIVTEVLKEFPTITLETKNLRKPLVCGKDISRQTSEAYNVLEVDEEIENHKLLREKASQVVEINEYATAQIVNHAKTEEISTIFSQLDVDYSSIDETKEEFATFRIETELNKIQAICNATTSHISTSLEESDYLETESPSESEKCLSSEVVEEIVRLYSVSYATMQDITTNIEEIDQLSIKKTEEEVVTLSLEPEEFYTVNVFCISLVSQVEISLYEIENFDGEPVKEEVAKEIIEVDVFSKPQSYYTEILQETQIPIEEIEIISIDVATSEFAATKEEENIYITILPVATSVITNLKIIFTEVEILEKDHILEEYATCEEEKREFYLPLAICAPICHYIELNLEEYNLLEVEKLLQELASTCTEPQVFASALSTCTSTLSQTSTIYIETESLPDEYFHEEKTELFLQKNIYFMALKTCNEIIQDIDLLLEESNERIIEKVGEEVVSTHIEPHVFATALSVCTSVSSQTSINYIEPEILPDELIQELKAESSLEKNNYFMALRTCNEVTEDINLQLEESNEFNVDNVEEEFTSIFTEPCVLVKTLPLSTSILNQIKQDLFETQVLEIENIGEAEADVLVEANKLTIILAMCIATIDTIYRDLEECTLLKVDEAEEEYANLSLEATQLNVASFAVSMAAARELNVNNGSAENYETTHLEQVQITNSTTERRDFIIAQAISNATVNNEYVNLNLIEDNVSCNFVEESAVIKIEPKYVKNIVSVQQINVAKEDINNQKVKYSKNTETISLTGDKQFESTNNIKQATCQDTFTNFESSDIQLKEDDVSYGKVTIIEEPIHFTTTKATNKTVRRKKLNTNEDSNVIYYETDVQSNKNILRLSETTENITDVKSKIIEAEHVIGNLTESSISINVRQGEEIINDEANVNVSIRQTRAKKEEAYEEMSYNLTLTKPQIIDESMSETKEDTVYIKKNKGLKQYHVAEEIQEELNLIADQDVEEECRVIIQEITDFDENKENSNDIENENESLDLSLELNLQTSQIQDTSDDYYETSTYVKRRRNSKENISNQEESAALTIVHKQDIVVEKPVIEMYAEENLNSKHVINTKCSNISKEYVNNSEIISSQSSGLQFESSLHEEIIDSNQISKRLSKSNTKSRTIRHSKDTHKDIGNGFTDLQMNTFESQSNMTEDKGVGKSMKKGSYLQESISSTFTSNQESDSTVLNKKSKSLSIETNIKLEEIEGSRIHIHKDESSPEIESPTKPPTPVTDEYIFRLTAPLPKSRGATPIPREPSPEIIEDNEDLNIVQTNLVPTIETVKIERVVYSPPLSTPPTSPVHSPTYTKPGLNGGMKRLPRYIKPGLRGGSDRPPIPKEEILEVRKNLSTLTSDINETLKNIEKYKKLVEILKHQKVEGEGSSKMMEEDETVVKQTNFEVVLDTQVKEKESLQQHSITTEKSICESPADSITIQPNTQTEDFVDINLKDENKIDTITIEAQQESSKKTKEAEERIKGYNIKEVTCFEEIEKEYENTGIVELAPDTAVENSIEKEDNTTHADDSTPVKTSTDNVVIIKEEIKDKKMDKPGDEINKTVDEEQKAADEEVARVTELTTDRDKSTAKEPSPIVTSPKEADIIKEAHVISLTRVLSSHMLREGLSPDCQKMKDKFEQRQNILEDEKQKINREEEKDRSWTTFLKKSTDLPLTQKLGNFVDLQNKFENQEPFAAKLNQGNELGISPAIKPRDFNSSPVPWQERALADTLGAPSIPKIEESELIPGEKPEFFLAIPIDSKDDGDLKSTVIPLPYPDQHRFNISDDEVKIERKAEEHTVEEIVQEAMRVVESLEIGDGKNRLIQLLLNNIKNIADSSIPVEDQLNQMKSQLVKLEQVPDVIRNTLESVAEQLHLINQKKEEALQTKEVIKYQKENSEPKVNISIEVTSNREEGQNIKEEETKKVAEMPAETKGELMVKDKKQSSFGPQMQDPQKTHSSRPQQKFGWMNPEPRPVRLPGGRRWRRPGEEYSEEQIAETILAYSEIIQGKTMGINFMKYEKPPTPLDHLQHSEVYKLIHNMEQAPPKRVEFLRTAIAAADYRERCRSLSSCPPESRKEQQSMFSMQLQP